MQLGWNDENSSFHINEHRINNTGWMMKCRWNRGVEQEADLLLRECWTFFTYIFLHQQWKQCLEFCLQNWEKSANIRLVLAIQTVMPVGYTILILSAKQGSEINAKRRVISENVSVGTCIHLCPIFLHYPFKFKPGRFVSTWNRRW
jgi:hypothetical protein